MKLYMQGLDQEMSDDVTGWNRSFGWGGGYKCVKSSTTGSCA